MTGKERLLKLADFLDTVDPSNFNMGRWVAGNPENLIYYSERNCGTVACAIGYCPIVFPEDWMYKNGHPFIHGNYNYGRDFFNLTEYEYQDLFLPDDMTDNPSPSEIANRIRKVASLH